MKDTLLSIAGMTVAYDGRPAVDNVDLEVQSGEILGIVGESGSGKSTLARAVLHLLPQNAVLTADRMTLGDLDLRALRSRDWVGVRGKRIALVPQNPLVALNPFLRIGDQLREAIEPGAPKDNDRLRRALDEVGIPEARLRLRAYPHQLSGGMRQRVLIAMALLNQPELILADEPTTALDVTVQAQILRLLRNSVHDKGATLVLITHNMGVVAELCDRVVVMYRGEIVEAGPVRQVLDQPQHEYTRQLIRVAGEIDYETRRFNIEGAS